MSDGRRNYQADKEKLRMAKNLVKSNNKKIKKALEAIDELEISFDMIFHDQDRDHIQVGYDIQKIKKILES
jgi:predicted O-methyltransferase YrrM